MVRAVVQLDAHVVDRITGENAARQRFLNALIDRLDVFLRNRSTDRVVLELIPGAGWQRDEPNLRLAELTAAAGLADEAPMAVGRGGQRFLVCDLRLADARFDAELALEAVDDD